MLAHGMVFCLHLNGRQAVLDSRDGALPHLNDRQAVLDSRVVVRAT